MSRDCQDIARISWKLGRNSGSICGVTGYLRIGDLAKRTGLSPEVIRAWEARYGLLRPSRSQGGFRLYTERDLARILRMKELIAQGISAAGAARRVLAEETSAGADLAGASLLVELRDRLERALDAFDEGAAHVVLDELFARFSLERALRDVVLPYLARLGERWATGEVTVGQEHFASGVIRGRLLGLARGWGSGIGPPIVLACPPGEEHELALMVFGIVAARRGWRVTYLGADTPFPTIAATVEAIRPTWVVLAVASPERVAGRDHELRQLASLARVAVGGHVDGDRVTRLGVRVLQGDPVTEALALTP